MLSIGCSPGSFFGNRKDAAVEKTQGARKINSACARMDLSSPVLDAPTLQRIIHCFNADGGMAALEQWVERAPSVHVEAITATLNQYLLSDPHLLYELEQSFRTLQARGDLDESLRHFGKLLENEELVTGVLAVLKDQYFADPRSQAQLLHALELLARRLSASDVGELLDAALNVAESRAFPELQRRFRGQAGLDLPQVAQGLLTYLSQSAPKTGVAWARAIADHGLLEALDEVLGQDPEALRRGIPRAASVLHALLDQQGRLLDETSALFRHLHGQPIACLKGAGFVDDGVLYVLRELSERSPEEAAEFLRRENVLALVSMNPFCSFPPELARHYPALLELADTSAMAPAAELLRALYRVKGGEGSTRPLALLLADTLADPALPRLTPVLAALEERGAWEDLLLVATLARPADRVALKDFLRFLIQPRVELQGQSIQEVLGEAVAHTQPKHLLALLQGLQRLLNSDSDEPILAPSLRALRRAFHANDVHPVVRLGTQLLGEASRNRPFFAALFAVSEMDEFKDTLRLVSRMAQDGRLRELLESVTVIYQKFAREGKTVIRETPVPAFAPVRRHDLRGDELTRFALVRTTGAETGACRKVDLATPMPRQLGPLAACLNDHGAYPDVVAVIEALPAQKSEDGRSLVELGTAWLEGLGLSREQLRFLVEGWMRAFDDGRFHRLLRAVPFWVQSVEPALPLVRPLASAELRPELAELGAFGAEVLRRTDFAQALRFADELAQAPVAQDRSSSPARDYGRATVIQALADHECRKMDMDARAGEVTREYKDAVTNWDTVEGKPRRHWAWEELRRELGALFDLLSEPRTERAGEPIFAGTSRILRYFTLQPGEARAPGRHFQPEQLFRYLKDRSADPRLITFFYPGDATPRVRLVNTLDRLELLLIEADFSAPYLGTNYGLKFLREIGLAWGDEDPAIWPEEIRKLSARGQRIKKLGEVVEEIKRTQARFYSLAGSPVPIRCGRPGEGTLAAGAMPLPAAVRAIRPNLHNARQVIDVLDQELRNGGLQVLRDLFFEVDPRAIMKLVRMGIFRQLGRGVSGLEAEDPATRDFFGALIAFSERAELPELMKALLAQDSRRELLWDLVGRAYQVEGTEAQDFHQSLFYLTATLGQLRLTGPLLKSTVPLLRQRPTLLHRHLSDAEGAVSRWLRSPELTGLARAFYESADSDGRAALAAVTRSALDRPELGLALSAILEKVGEPEFARAWELFRTQAAAVAELPAYQRLALGEIGRDWLDFFEERGGDARAADAARRIRIFLAERLERGELEQLLTLIQANPDEFYRVLKALSRAMEKEDRHSGAWEFFALARRSLSLH